MLAGVRHLRVYPKVSKTSRQAQVGQLYRLKLLTVRMNSHEQEEGRRIAVTALIVDVVSRSRQLAQKQ